jgi:predicted ester cyclase
MSTEQNKAMVHRIFEEGINENNLATFDELVAPNYVNYGFPDLPPGPEGLKIAVNMFATAFHDFRVTVEDTIAEGDRVASRGVFTGTHEAEFQGIPPTGKRISVAYMDIWRVENGRFVENWVQLDMLGLMQQLGVVPSPGQ